MDIQGEINKYKTDLAKASKKKLINMIVKLTIQVSKLETSFMELKKEKKK